MPAIAYSPNAASAGGTDPGVALDTARTNAALTISAISVATAAVVTTSTPHLLSTGDTVTIAGTNSTPVLDGSRVVTVIDATHFSVPVTTTILGTTGTATPTTFSSALQLDRGLLSGGGAILIANTGGGSPTATANIQGSIDGVNWFNIPYALVGTPRTFVVTAISLTTTATGVYLLQELVGWRFLRILWSVWNNETITATAWSR